MGMKIQAINTGDGLSIEVGKTYYIEDNGYDITVHRIPIASADGYAYPLTAAGAEELSAEIERAIDEHEAHLETIAQTEVAM